MKTPKWFALVCVSFLVVRDAAAQSPNVAATAGEKRNAIAGSLAATSPGSAALPLASSLQLVLQSPPTTSVDSVAVAPDGSLVATASGEGGVRLYDARSGELRRAWAKSETAASSFRPMAARWLPQDSTWTSGSNSSMSNREKSFARSLATARSRPARSRFLRTGNSWRRPAETMRSWSGMRRPGLSSIASTVRPRSPSPTRPIVARWQEDGADRTIRLWDAATGDLRREFQGHSDSVVSLSFSPDGETIASGSCDWANHRGRDTANFAWRDPGCISEWKIWNVAQGQLQRSEQVPGRLLRLAFAPDGQSLAGAIGKEVQLYELANKRPARILASYDFDATSVAFTPDGTSLVSGSHDQTLKRVNVASGQVEWQAPGDWEQINSIALSADGLFLVTGSSDHRFAVRTLKAGDRGLRPGAARLWDARTGRLLLRLGQRRRAGDGRGRFTQRQTDCEQWIERQWFWVCPSVRCFRFRQLDHERPSFEVLTACFCCRWIDAGDRSGRRCGKAPRSSVWCRRSDAAGSSGRSNGACLYAQRCGASLRPGPGRGSRVGDPHRLRPAAHLVGRGFASCVGHDGSTTLDEHRDSFGWSESFLEVRPAWATPTANRREFWGSSKLAKVAEFAQGADLSCFHPMDRYWPREARPSICRTCRVAKEDARLTGHLKKVQSIAFLLMGDSFFSGGDGLMVGSRDLLRLVDSLMFLLRWARLLTVSGWYC